MPSRVLSLLTVVAAALLCACSSARSSGQEAAAATAAGAQQHQPPATIRWSFWGDPQERSVDERIVRLFEKEHPEIHVETLWAPYDQYLTALDSWNSAGTPPDVSFLWDIPAFAAAGKLANLSPQMQRDHYELGDFYPALLDQFRFHDDLYGLPRDNDTKVIFYNRDLFDAAHLPYPAPSWNWQDLRSTARALTQRGTGGSYGFAFEPRSWWTTWLWQNGGQVYDDSPAPTRSLLDSAAAVGAFTFLRDLIHADAVTPPYEQMTTSQSISSLFTAGKVAMAYGNHALVPLFAATPGLHWGAAPLPAGVRQANFAGGAGYAISAGSTEPEAAWTFLQWLLSGKGEAIFAESGLIVPSRRSVGASNLFLHQGGAPNDRAASAVAAGGPATSMAAESARVFLGETERGVGLPAFPSSTTIRQAIDAGLEPIWRDGADPRSVLDALVPQIDRLLQGDR